MANHPNRESDSLAVSKSSAVAVCFGASTTTSGEDDQGQEGAILQPESMSRRISQDARHISAE